MRQVIIIFFFILMGVITLKSEYAFPESYQDFQGANGETYRYEKPEFSKIITDLPSDFLRFGKLGFNQETLPLWGIVAGTTGVLYYYDDEFYRETKRGAARIDSDTHDRKKVLFRVFNQPFQIPDNFYTSLYHIGDGFTELLLNLSFYGYGYGANDYRAQSTAHQLTKGLILITTIQQSMKRVFGRQTPKRATGPRGHFNPFPSQKDYNSHKASYDSFPSGHIATLMTSLTIIAENYGDYPLIWPVGAGVAGVLGVSMVVVGVHWYSDYPLAIALGYFMGKAVSNKEKRRLHKDNKNLSLIDKLDVVPIINYTTGEPGIGLSYQL